MGRKAIEVTSLHGLTIEDLNALAKRANNNYTYTVTQAIIMRYQGIETSVIATTLSKSYATIINYLNDWNNTGLLAISDARGGKRPNTFTDEMLEGLRDVVETKSPQDFDFEQSKWDSNTLARYIEETYGKQYSDTWIRNMLKGLGFSYKRGVYKPTLGDAALQENFKKKCQSSWI